MARLGKDAARRSTTGASAAIMTSTWMYFTGTRTSEGLADGRVKGSSTR